MKSTSALSAITSRNCPLCNEPHSLTPGHFLIGRPLLAPPSHPASQAKISSLRRWQLTKRLAQDFWIAWKSQYLQALQRRHTWHKGNHTFKEGDVVFLKDNEVFGYRRWPLTRIKSVYPGDDGIVRVTDVLCKGRTLRRSTQHLIPLQVDENDAPCGATPPHQYVQVQTTEQGRVAAQAQAPEIVTLQTHDLTLPYVNYIHR